MAGGGGARSPTCKRMGVGQGVTREIDEGAMLRVDELRLGSHVAGVLHGAGRVDHIHLRQTERRLSVPDRHVLRS